MEMFTPEELVQVERAIEIRIDDCKKAIVDYQTALSLGLVEDKNITREYIIWHERRVSVLESALKKIGLF